ncbi:hypothetical protein ACFV6B_38120 [Streptomyces microflavus]|uniref:hypothetical protein n=1 Tax=Streptomyces microflavus TaxID=1919 RepID=UPI003648C703
MYVCMPADLPSLEATRNIVASQLTLWRCSAAQIHDAQLLATELAIPLCHTDTLSYDLVLQRGRHGAVTIRVGSNGLREVPRPRTPLDDLPDTAWPRSPARLSALATHHSTQATLLRTNRE